jgi:tetratricopeptide (TPR) repeat protein
MKFNYYFTYSGIIKSVICFISILVFANICAAQVQSELLYFKVIAATEADKEFQDALHLKKTGDTAQALEKYESAVVSKRFLLSENSGGLKELLIDKYEKLSAQGKGIENYYKLGYLYDLTGDLENSVKNYNLALKLAATDTIKQHITSLLDGVKKDENFYEKLNSQSSKLPEAYTPPAETDENAGKTAGDKPGQQSDTALKIKESKIADYKDRIEEIDSKIAAAGKKLEEAQEQERKSKNDWSGRADFKRDWRDTPSSDPVADQSDNYQNTYRRRYRQAKSAREDIEKELAALKEDKKKAEDELKAFEEENTGDTPPPAEAQDGTTSDNNDGVGNSDSNVNSGGAGNAGDPVNTDDSEKL